MLNYRKILQKDQESAKEISRILDSGNNLPIAKKMGVSQNIVRKAFAMEGPLNEFPRAEAMIQMHLRPALLIRNNKIETPASVELRKRLLPYLPKIESRVPSVGRIDFKKMGRSYGGTGWMAADDIIVTNRHVANLFAEKKRKSFVFRKNSVGETIEAFIDYKEEYAGAHIAAPQFEVQIEKVVYIANDQKSVPDIAFLKVKKESNLPSPIPITDKPLKKGQFISVIGYPAYDPDAIISLAAAEKVFGGIYEVKRCSPGEVNEFDKDGWYFFHDCTTLGGNSGSVVIDNATGIAVGLHFMGEVKEENYAVKGAEVLKYLKKVSNKTMVSKVPFKHPKDDISLPSKRLEATPESFDDRKGFDEKFLGANNKVQIPTIVKHAGDVLKYKLNGKYESLLRYEHYSVVMNKARRMPFFSACNIDGKLSKKGVKRSTWKFDSRIPLETQILKECYGNPPKFSRGHMTRKEDPIWGTMEIAVTACSDTFHATNICPQMQPFNAPVWLALEDYALENARQDDMKISVITGPFFKPNDPVKYEVKIPVTFYKIIAFIHDDTKKLCATGYTVSQEDYLTNEEFVYGAFNTYQVAIKTIERFTGLKFGTLAKHDPIKGEESVPSALASLNDIRFF